MRQRIIIVVVLMGSLAYILRDVIDALIIQPLLYFTWFLKLSYDSFPHVVLWIVLVVVIAFTAASSLIADTRGRGRMELLRKPVSGPIESLADWMVRAPSGTYFKWLVAQRLGKLSRGLIAFQTRAELKEGGARLDAPGWNPPGEVKAYLESGLNGSFADFPRPRWPFQKPKPTPLDIDPVAAIDYVESKAEKA